MEANEFIKKFGLDEAEIAIEDCKDNDLILFQHNETLESGMVDRGDLKRLVEAHEIIKLFKSLDHAKTEALACEHSKHSEILVKLDDGVGYIWLSRVKQAIIDVESCQ